MERLLHYHNNASSVAATPTNDPTITPTGTAASVSARCVLLHEFIPALGALMGDGLKQEVITSFGRMPTSVWRLVEAIARSGGGGVGGGASGCSPGAVADLVMLLNAREDDEDKKFAGFVVGLLK